MAKASKAVKAAKRKPAKILKATASSARARGRGGPHPVDVHVGARVRLRRMILGISQESLGNALGLTFQQIQKYEKGANRIGASRLFELSDLLDVPIQYFYDDYGDMIGAPAGFTESDPGDAFMELVNSPEGVQLCRYFSAIDDPHVKKRVLDLVKTIAETEGEKKH